MPAKAKVQAVPAGYHTVTPYFTVKGAAKLIDFLKKAFNAEERFRMPGPNGTVAHAELKIGDSMVMIGDAGDQWPVKTGQVIYTWKIAIAFTSRRWPPAPLRCASQPTSSMATATPQ